MTTLQARARHAEFGLDAPGNNRQARVQALLARVEEPYREPCRSILAGEPFTFTQAWQDWWLFHNLYFDRLTWGDGAYVDIGTNREFSFVTRVLDGPQRRPCTDRFRQ